MKKCLSLILIFALSVMLVLVACDSSGYGAMTVESEIYSDSLTLHFKNTQHTSGGNLYDFRVSNSLEELEEMIDLKYSKLSTTVYDNKYIIIEKSLPSDGIEYYLITKMHEGTDENPISAYRFSNMTKGYTRIRYPTHQGDYYRATVPIHFMILCDYDYCFYELEFNKPHETTATIEEFYDFYAKINILNLSIEENTLFVDIKNDVEMHGNHTRESFKIIFEEKSGKNFVTFEYDTPLAS